IRRQRTSGDEGRLWRCLTSWPKSCTRTNLKRLQPTNDHHVGRREGDRAGHTAKTRNDIYLFCFLVSFFPFLDLLLRAQAVQTDSNTGELGVNTDPDWESQVAAMLEYSSTLTEQYTSLMKKQGEEEQAKAKEKQQLQKKEEEAVRQHQVSPTHTHVKTQIHVTGVYLTFRLLDKELKENEEKLNTLKKEQSEEQSRWQEELEELRQEMEQVRREAQEADLQALKDEIAAVEKQRDVAMERIEAWLKELTLDLVGLRWGSTPPTPALPSPSVPAPHQSSDEGDAASQPLPVSSHSARGSFPASPRRCHRRDRRSSSAPSSAPTGKLDKVLEKLGTRFPQCNRAQLTSLLQQVKISRGTLAGMSMEEVMEQVGVKLAQSERPAPGPISRPTPPGPIQRPASSPQRGAAGGGQSVGPRKLCLMCQNLVDPDSRHPLSCSHIIHKDCIRMWLQSSKNNSCPFCPAK
uniref:RING-type domain-containing protein n=1 Tax=Labrus bergylta TaxID=56723 RepID=A0A3Q3KU65_9LABR